LDAAVQAPGIGRTGMISTDSPGPISVSVSSTVEMLPIYFAFFGFSAISTRRPNLNVTVREHDRLGAAVAA
jgi:hypothetical protein